MAKNKVTLNDVNDIQNFLPVPSDRKSAWENFWNIMPMLTSATMRD